MFYINVVFQELDPEEFVSFKNKVVIKKADVRKYEQELKKELSKWIVLGQRQKVTIVTGLTLKTVCSFNIIKIICSNIMMGFSSPVIVIY